MLPGPQASVLLQGSRTRPVPALHQPPAARGSPGLGNTRCRGAQSLWRAGPRRCCARRPAQHPAPGKTSPPAKGATVSGAGWAVRGAAGPGTGHAHTCLFFGQAGEEGVVLILSNQSRGEGVRGAVARGGDTASSKLLRARLALGPCKGGRQTERSREESRHTAGGKPPLPRSNGPRAHAQSAAAPGAQHAPSPLASCSGAGPGPGPSCPLHRQRGLLAQATPRHAAARFLDKGQEPDGAQCPGLCMRPKGCTAPSWGSLRPAPAPGSRDAEQAGTQPSSHRPHDPLPAPCPWRRGQDPACTGHGRLLPPADWEATAL